MLDHNTLSQPLPPVTWCKDVPIKFIGILRRAIQGRIPQALVLAHHGIILNSTLCGSCVGIEDDTYHLLIYFLFATCICDSIFRWCGIHILQCTSFGELINFANNQGMCEKMRINFLVICYGLTWGCGNSGMTEFFRAFSPIQEDVSIALSL